MSEQTQVEKSSHLVYEVDTDNKSCNYFDESTNKFIFQTVQNLG